MKKNLLAFAVTLLVITAQSAAAAIQYEFRQTTSSVRRVVAHEPAAHNHAVRTHQFDRLAGIEVAGYRGDSGREQGRAPLHDRGDRSRVEFVSGNEYPRGTYIIATNGSRSMTFIDPSRKSFVEVNGASVATSIGARKITVANKKINVTKMPDQDTVAGIPTEHYRMTMSYDITVAFGNLPLTQTVKTIIDKWTTNAFGEVGDTFLAGGALHTGNPDLDDLISAENSNIKGFALRQIVNVTTINNRAPVNGESQLKVNRTVTQTRELLVTSIQPVAQVGLATFTVPVTFHKAGPVHDDTQKAPMQMLSMEPSGEKQ